MEKKASGADASVSNCADQVSLIPPLGGTMTAATCQEMAEKLGFNAINFDTFYLFCYALKCTDMASDNIGE